MPDTTHSDSIPDATPKAWRGADLGVTPETFIETLIDMKALRPDDRVVVGRKKSDRVDAAGQPVKTGFTASRYPETLLKRKHHVSIGLQEHKTDGFSDGGQSSKRENWTGGWALVFDDIHEKVDAPPVLPTVIIETKPGSEQWWYVFDTPVRNGHLMEELIDKARDAGLTDRGMSNVVRWARLPGSQPPGKVYAARVTRWVPDLRFDPVALAEALGLVLGSHNHWNGRASFARDAAGEEIDDPVLEWLREHGMIVGSRSCSGYYPIICPRAHEHSEGETAGYAPQRENGSSDVHCFHGHSKGSGEDLLVPEFQQYLIGCGMPKELAMTVGKLTPGKRPEKMAEGFTPVTETEGMTALEKRQARKAKAAAQADVAAVAAQYGMVLEKEVGADTNLISRVGDGPEDYYYNRVTNTYLHETKEIELNPEPFNTDMVMRHGATTFTLPGMDGPVKPTLYHRASFSDRGVDGVEYVPSEGVTFIDPRTRKAKLNGFQRIPMPAIVPDTGGRCRIFRDLYMDGLGPVYGKTVMQFAAHLIQKPGVKIKWVPLIVGAGGAGKSFMAKIPQAALGAHAAPAGVEVLYTPFQASLTGKVLVVFDEIHHVEEGDSETFSEKFKRFIDEPYIDVADKNVKRHTVRNVTNYMASTNHRTALHMDDDGGTARRWGVFEAMPSVTDWDQYWSIYTHEGGLLRGWLMDVDISDFNPNAWAPDSEAKTAMMTASEPGNASIVVDAMERGGSWIFTEAGVVALPKLLEVVQDVCADQKEPPMRNATLKKTLIKMGWDVIPDADRPKVLQPGTKTRASVRVAYSKKMFPRGLGAVERFVELVRREPELIAKRTNDAGKELNANILPMKPKT